MVDGEEIIPFVKQFCDSRKMSQKPSAERGKVKEENIAFTLQSGSAQGEVWRHKLN